AAREQTEHVPGRAEWVEGTEGRAGDAHDRAVRILAKRRESRHPGLLAPESHVLDEAGVLRGHHREAPAAAGRELALHLGCIRGTEDEGGAVREMGSEPVETVRPHRAVAATAAHVVDQNEVGLGSEELREPYGPVPAMELVVAHGFRG